MTTIIKKIILGLVLGSSLLIYSCSDDFLNRYPLDSPNPENFFVDEASAKQAAIACYRPWTQLEGNMYYKEFIILMDALTDDSDIRLNGSDRIQMRNWEFLPNHNIISQWWEFPLQSVNATNYAIQQIPTLLDKGIPQETLDPYIAEARFMRAYNYLYFVTFFGEVPLITKPLSSFEEFSQPKASIDEIYNQIIDDFTFAKEKLSDDRSTGTPTQASAAAYLAKTYLYKKDYINAESAAREAITLALSSGYALIDDYQSIFDINNEENPELLFYFSYVRNDADYGQTMSVERGIRDIPGALNHIQGGEGWGYALPMRDLYDAFENGDPRRGWTVYAPGDFLGIYNKTEPFTYTHKEYNSAGEIVSTDITYNAGDTVRYDYQWSPTGLNVKKLTENLSGLTNIRYAGLDIPLMRMADLYLILAEALAEQGKAEALVWVNKVRARSSVNMPPKTTSDGTLVDIVRHERRVELAMEGQRAWDLMRWGNLKEVFGDGKKVKLHFYSDYLTDMANKFMDPTSGLSKFPTNNILFPIPQDELDQNSMINSNNPGY